MAKSKVKTAVVRAGTKATAGSAKKTAARGLKAVSKSVPKTSVPKTSAPKTSVPKTSAPKTSLPKATAKVSPVKVAKAAKAKPAPAKPVKAAKAVKTVADTAAKTTKAGKSPVTTKSEQAAAVETVNVVVPAQPALNQPAVKEAPAAPRQPLTLPKRAADQTDGQVAIQTPSPAAEVPVSAVKPAPRPTPPAPRPVHGAKQQQRADIPPASGFTLVVDGHFKNQYDDVKAATSAGAALLGKFPMLRIEIYDATQKKRLPI